MHAWILHDINHLQYEETPLPDLQKGEVLLKVSAAGICGSDIPRIYQTGAHVHPLIPGHEFAGIVVDAFDEADRQFIGKRCGVFPLIPCGTCPACQTGRFQLCRHYSYLGSRCNGGFAEYAAVPSRNLLPLPDSVPLEAAAMLEPLAVATHAMRRVGIHPSSYHTAFHAITGSCGTADSAAQSITDSNTMSDSAANSKPTVLVIGLGTIGLLLAMLLKEAGITKIFAVGNKDFQKQKFSEIGLSCFCDSRTENPVSFVRSHTEGLGADFVFECVGKSETCQTAIDCAGIGAAVLLMGNPYGTMTLSRDTYWKILRNELEVKGTWNSSFAMQKYAEITPAFAGFHAKTVGDTLIRSHTQGGENTLADSCAKTESYAMTNSCASARDDWHYVLDRLADGRLHPERIISHRFPLSGLEQGLHIMRDKSEDYGKCMITPESPS